MYDWGAICNTRNLRDYVPFVAGGFHLGWINLGMLGVLRGEPEFAVSAELVELDPDLRTPPQRTAVLADLAGRWRDRGLVAGWRGELYDVVPYPGGPVVLQMERAVTRIFGTINVGAHVNGYVRTGADLLMWIGRRSPDKPTFPGRLDQLAAGGVAASVTPATTARREVREEAGIDAFLANSMREVSAVTMFMEHDGCILRDIDHIFDLEMPIDFVPHPADGEVAEFELHPADALLDTVTTSDRFKPDCNLVVLDFLIRHRLLTDDARLLRDVHLGLRKGV
ncbi:NUDIX hydrolase [Nocardia mexicana]|uniref:NUDIX domain-containing protein n=1 Tax=Nocardia mexicana TaxID=279262 RepID=A0A370HE88_9NOCA|nr:DUF4743 domain-containing protein [Nocardia mexicana]RDI55567.1 NUDIX domain-containing protein [Nocardia mexicana]